MPRTHNVGHSLYPLRTYWSTVCYGPLIYKVVTCKSLWAKHGNSFLGVDCIVDAVSYSFSACCLATCLTPSRRPLRRFVAEAYCLEPQLSFSLVQDNRGKPTLRQYHCSQKGTSFGDVKVMQQTEAFVVDSTFSSASVDDSIELLNQCIKWLACKWTISPRRNSINAHCYWLIRHWSRIRRSCRVPGQKVG